MSLSFLQLLGIALGSAVVGYVAGVMCGVRMVTTTINLQAKEERSKEGYE